MAAPIRPAVQTKLNRLAFPLTWALLAAASLITFGEIDRLIAGSIGSDGISHPLGTVIGPGASGESKVWSVWAGGGLHGAIGTWIILSTLVDFVLIASYYLLLRRPARHYPIVRGTLLVLVCADLVEDLLLIIGGGLVVGAPDDLTSPSAEAYLVALGAVAFAVAIVSTAKVVALIALPVVTLWNKPSRRALYRFSRSLGWALWIHRLSVVLLVALVVLACIPTDEVLDQLPDIQRQWVDDNWAQFVWAGLALLIAALSFFALGRQRSDRIRRTWVDLAPPGTPLPWRLGRVSLWLIAPAIFGVPALIALLVGQAWEGSVWNAVAFFAIPFALIVVSLLLRRFKSNLWKWTGPTARSRRRPIWVWVVGDVLAVLVIAVGGLGIARSFAGPVFLDVPGGLADVGAWPTASLMFIFGVVLATLAPHLLRITAVQASSSVPAFFRESLDPDVPTPNSAGHRFVRLVVFFVGFLFLAWVVLTPVVAAHALGAVALTVGIVAAWIMVLGSFTVMLQSRLPLELFRALHLKASPVLTMAITIPLVTAVALSSLNLGDSSLHAVRLDEQRTDATFVPKERGDLEKWLSEEGAPCVVTRNEVSVKPVIFVVAEGGGIRAAYWTASVLDALGAHGDCVMLSSGVSGGSVGLAIARAIGGDARDVAQRLAQPDTLSSGVAGLLASDIVASATGLHVPSLINEGSEEEPRNEWKWRDRATLIEGEWITWEQTLTEGFSDELGAPTGALVLNSTDSVSKCRVLVSQFKPEQETEPMDDRKSVVCNRPGQLASSVTLSAAYDKRCLGDLDWATAALFSGRFPIITPAGGFPVAGSADCAEGPALQLIDGGYAEGSGLATMADLSPELADIVRSYNATADGSADKPFAVPTILFARNGVGFDLVQAAGKASAETLVPIVGYGAQKELSDQDAWIQRIIASFAEACAANPKETAGDCADALSDQYESIPGGIVAVAPSTRPTVAPPLGWALSCYTQKSLQSALEKEKTTKRDIGRFGRLADLYAYLGVVPTKEPLECTPPER